MDKENLYREIRDMNLQKCPRESHHRDFKIDEICVDKNCKNQYDPICSVCKFERHQFCQLQNIKVFLLDVTNDSFKRVKALTDFSDEQVYQIGFLMEKLLDEVRQIQKMSYNLLNNMENMHQKYINLQFDDTPEKNTVRFILTDIINSQNDINNVAFHLKKMRGIVTTDREKRSFINDEFQQNNQKNDILHNAKTIIEQMRSNNAKMKILLKLDLEVSDPKKISKKWIERYNLEKNKGLSSVQITLGQNQNDILTEIENLRKKTQQFSQNSNFGYNSAIYQNQGFNSSLQNNISQSNLYNKGEFSRDNKYNKKIQVLSDKLQNLKQQMLFHLNYCRIQQCKFVVPTVYDVDLYEIVKDKIYRTQLTCQEGQQLNNEMKLVKQELNRL